MTTIATYRNLMLAELAKTRLESRGIEVTIADVFSYTMGYGSVMDGVRLQVPDEDAERAKEILATREFIDLPGERAMIAESQETDAGAAGAFMEPAGQAVSSRGRGWPGLALFLLGLFCLILGRPAGDGRVAHRFSGQLILVGEMSIVAGLWISYGRLCEEGEDE